MYQKFALQVNAGHWDCAIKAKLEKTPYDCCKLVKFISDDVMQECKTEFGPKAGGPPPMPPPGEKPAGCVSYPKTLMLTHKLI